MKKLILLLLISGGLSAQVVIPKSTTTFSNISATGNLTVNGTARVTGATTLTGAATLSSSTTIGTGTVAANTSSLGILRVKQNANWADFGDYGSGYFGIWTNQAIPTVTNYAWASGSTSMEFNHQSQINLNIAGVTKFFQYSTYGYERMPFRIGSIVAPSATLDVTGTMSVSGTSTLTGAAKQTNTLNYEGNTTWNTNQTNTLTTGNTGTVAVLSDAVFAVNFLVGFGQNPVDATTYYLAQNGYPWQTGSIGAFTAPYNLTLVGYNTSMSLSGVGSAESATLQVFQNATTATTLNTTMNYNSSFTYTVGGLSINIDANQKIEPRIITPTWVTNPTGVYQNVTFLFVRRQ